jgi:hypothetical protein
VRDFRLWWALFVFFGALSVLAVQRAHRRWWRARVAVAARPGPERELHARRIRREGWRLACMSLSVLAMTTLVFAALLGAPAAVILFLRLLAIGAVAGVIWLSLSR